MVRASLVWDQGSELAQHAKVSLATATPVYFADPRSPWQRPSNENTNRLHREYLPKGTVIPHHQPHLTTIAEEINNRPAADSATSPPPKPPPAYSPANPMLLRRLDTTLGWMAKLSVWRHCSALATDYTRTTSTMPRGGVSRDN